MPSLYRRILGLQFDRLPGSLRQFHGQASGTAAGIVQVTRGTGRLCNWLADLVGLPPAGSASVTLKVHETRQGEQWQRAFGLSRFDSDQWQDGELLIEAVGPVRVEFRLLGSERGLEFHHMRSWLAWLPVGRLIHVRASALAAAEGWRIDVRVDSCLGLLVRYEGKVVAR